MFSLFAAGHHLLVHIVLRVLKFVFQLRNLLTAPLIFFLVIRYQPVQFLWFFDLWLPCSCLSNGLSRGTWMLRHSFIPARISTVVRIWRTEGIITVRKMCWFLGCTIWELNADDSAKINRTAAPHWCNSLAGRTTLAWYAISEVRVLFD